VKVKIHLSIDQYCKIISLKLEKLLNDFPLLYHLDTTSISVSLDFGREQ